jgi:hypothetical protein
MYKIRRQMMYRISILSLIALAIMFIPLSADNAVPGCAPSASIDQSAASAFQSPTIEEGQLQIMMQNQNTSADLSSGVSLDADIATQEGENLIIQQKMDEDIKEAKQTAKESQQSDKNKKLLKQIQKHLTSNLEKPGENNTGSSDSTAETH